MAGDYSKNQFYNFGTYEAGIFNYNESQVTGVTDNPPFIYPPKTLRNAVNGVTTPIQRGYLRMLGELFYEQDKTIARRRLHFQFNPDSITRQVTARNDIQLWMNMDPSQMTMPIPGDANFAFELLFNREPEVGSGKYIQGSGALAAPSSSPLNATRAASEINDIAEGAYSRERVVDIGVLADLIVLDEIIGQGLNKQLLKTLVDRAEVGSEYTAAKDAQNTTDSTSDEEDQSPKQQNTSKFDRSQVEQALNANWGNSAFLISQPIRVVFSSLFMVEGYVTSTQVTFNKFTPTMVPVQAVVGIQMQAMYIGFAKKDTFFTKTFKMNEEEYADAIAERTAEEKALSAAASKLFYSPFRVSGEQNNYAIRIEDIRGDTDTSKGNENAWVEFEQTNELLSLIENGNVSKITSSANLKVTYMGNTGSPSSGTTLVSGDVIYDETSTLEVEAKKGRFKAEHQWPRLQGWPDSKVPDKSSTSKYRYELLISFTLVSNNGTSVDAPQTAVMDVTKAWGNLVVLNNELSLPTNAAPPARSTKKKAL